MSNYEQKYLTYKAKYFALQQKLSQKGGMPEIAVGDDTPIDPNWIAPATPTIRTYDSSYTPAPVPMAAPAPAPATTTTTKKEIFHHILDPFYNPYLPALQYLQPKPYVRPYYEPAYSTDYLNYDPYEDKPRRASRRTSRRRTSRRSSRKSSKKSSKRKSRK